VRHWEWRNLLALSTFPDAKMAQPLNKLVEEALRLRQHLAPSAVDLSLERKDRVGDETLVFKVVRATAGISRKLKSLHPTTFESVFVNIDGARGLSLLGSGQLWPAVKASARHTSASLTR
jgi:hypothetical protein